MVPKYLIFSVHNAIILDTQIPSDVTITYHATLNDAQARHQCYNKFTAVHNCNYNYTCRVTHISGQWLYCLNILQSSCKTETCIKNGRKWHGCEGEDIVITADSGLAATYGQMDLQIKYHR